VVLDFYVLRLCLPPFLGSLLLVTGVMLISRALKILELVVERGVDWHVMGVMLVSVLPYLLVLTLPIALFFGMQHVVVRLSQESELDALRAAGISYARAFRSLAVFTFCCWLLLNGMTMFWMPSGLHRFQELLDAVMTSKASLSFDAQRFNTDMDNFTVYVEGEDSQGRLHGFMLEDNRPGGPVIYLAETAEIRRAGRQLRFTLHRGTRLEGGGAQLRSLSFDEYTVSIDVGDLGLLKVPERRNGVFEMNILRLSQLRRQHDSPEAAAEWHRRWVLPGTVFVFLLFVLPLSLMPKRAGRVGAYLLGLCLILAVYNLQIILHQQVAKGALPWWSMWLNLFGWLALGGYLCYRASQDRLPALLAQSGEAVYLIHQRLNHWLSHRLGKA